MQFSVGDLVIAIEDSKARVDGLLAFKTGDMMSVVEYDKLSDEVTVKHAGSDGWMVFFGPATSFMLYIPEGSCNHEWKDYWGFRESYQFCVKCDEKREANFEN